MPLLWLASQAEPARAIFRAEPSHTFSSCSERAEPSRANCSAEPDRAELEPARLGSFPALTGSQNNGGGLRLVEEYLIQSILQSCYLSFKLCSNPLYQLVVVVGLGSLPTPIRVVVVCESMTPRYVNPLASRATRVLLVSQGRR